MELYKRGSKGEMVKQIQRVLASCGYSPGIVDGVFGFLTEEAVKEFQKKNNLSADGIVGPATLSKLGIEVASQCLGITKKSKRRIDKIIVHCTATPPFLDVTVNEIRRWHKAQGWADIGYHYVVYLDGSIHEGRDVDVSGAHCEGQNQHSIGVVYVGGVDTDRKTPKDTRTPEQMKGLLSILQQLRKLYPNAKIYGHRDFSKKACPSFNARSEYSNI